MGKINPYEEGLRFKGTPVVWDLPSDDPATPLTLEELNRLWAEAQWDYHPYPLGSGALTLPMLYADPWDAGPSTRLKVWEGDLLAILQKRCPTCNQTTGPKVVQIATMVDKGLADAAWSHQVLGTLPAKVSPSTLAPERRSVSSSTRWRRPPLMVSWPGSPRIINIVP